MRTLSSYVLGCDDGSYARLNPTDGYIALFSIPQRASPPNPLPHWWRCERIWIVQAIARSRARTNSAFCAAGSRVVSGGDLIKTLPGGERRQCTLDQIYTELRKNSAKPRSSDMIPRKPISSVFTGALRGKREGFPKGRPCMQPKRFPALWRISRYTQHQRVRGHGNPGKKDLGEAIRAVSDLMKTIHSMEADATT